MATMLEKYKDIEIGKIEFRKRRIESTKLQGYSMKLEKNWET